METFTVILVSILASTLHAQECKWQSMDKVWLERMRPLNQVYAQSVVGAFCSQRPLEVQLWIKDGTFSYRLVWRHRVVPQSIGTRVVVPLPKNKFISILPEHRLALYSLDVASVVPVPVLFSSDHGGQLVPVMVSGPYLLQNRYSFDDLGRPNKFDLDFCSTSECLEERKPSTIPTSTLSPTPVPKGVCGKVMNSTGKVLLQRKRVFPAGSVRAVLAPFCGNVPVQIQVWGPSGDNAKQYKMLWSKTIEAPSTDGSVRVIPLQPHEQFYYKSEYRTAVFVRQVGATIPIPYSFNGGSSLVQSMDGKLFKPCDLNTFDSLGYPMKFLLDFCADNECRGSPSATDRGVGQLSMCADEGPVPTSTHTPTKTTSTTQIPIEKPKTIIERPKNSCTLKINSTGKVLLEKKRVLPSGWVRAVGAHFCAEGDVVIQVWEPVKDQPDVYRLVWHKRIAAPSGDGSWKVVALKPKEEFYFKSSHRLGIFLAEDGATVPVPYRLNPPSGALVQSLHKTNIDWCHSSEFEQLGYPLEFSVQFCKDKECEHPPDDAETDISYMEDVCDSMDVDEKSTKQTINRVKITDTTDKASMPTTPTAGTPPVSKVPPAANDIIPISAESKNAGSRTISYDYISGVLPAVLLVSVRL